MFSGIFSSISLYIILVLAATLSVSGYLNYQYIGDIAVANKTIKDQAKVVSDYENSTKSAKQSCDTDVQSVVEVAAEQKELSTKIETVVVKIASLQSGVKKTVISAAKSATSTKETSNVEKQNEFLVGPELLSLDLVLLLNTAFCSVEPTDSLCRSPGQSTN